MLHRVASVLPAGPLSRALRRELTERGSLVSQLAPGSDIGRLRQGQFDVVLLAARMVPQPLSNTVRMLRSLAEQPEVIVLDKAPDSHLHAELLHLGCSAALDIELPPALLAEAIQGVLDRREEERRFVTASESSIAEPRLDDFVSTSQVMQAMLRTAYRVASADSSLVVLGETGVGKERLARAIHAESPRRFHPFVAVNCAAIPENLLESELFGHTRGAFTGAIQARRGAFEQAHLGTLFLDEIGELPTNLQGKLLRAIQEKEFLKLGGERPIRVDVRIVAATNRDLQEEMAQGTFRRDLYYRLGVVVLELPPLRQRRDDIPALVENYAAYLAPRIGVEPRLVTPAAMEACRNYPWPGNVRELANVIERALILGDDEWIDLDHLPDEIAHSATGQFQHSPSPQSIPRAEPVPEWEGQTWSQARSNLVEHYEPLYLQQILAHAHGRIKDAAALAGLTPRALHYKMKRHGLHKEQFQIAPSRPARGQGSNEPNAGS
jgi:DNA-binding NtrC family response regulator